MAKATRKQLTGGVFPGNDQLQASGGSSDVSTTDWYTHSQLCDVMYVRKVQFDSTVSSPMSVPNIQYNYVDAHYTVQTVDEIWENANFSGESQLLQTLEIINNIGNVSGGLGLSGVVNTSTAGYIRRPARKDAQGNYLDPTGVCTYQGNYTLDKTPGTYDNAYDTSSNLNANIAQLVGKWSVDCPTFLAGLVDL